MSQVDIKATRLGLADAELYRELMLEGYAAHPDAFTSTAAERAALPLSWWQGRLTEEPEAAALVLGVKLEATLAGGSR